MPHTDHAKMARDHRAFRAVRYRIGVDTDKAKRSRRLPRSRAKDQRDNLGQIKPVAIEKPHKPAPRAHPIAQLDDEALADTTANYHRHATMIPPPDPSLFG